MAITREFVQEVRRRIMETPSIRTDILARELHASESQVITALPVNMRIRAKNADFANICRVIAGWTGTLSLEGPATASIPEAHSRAVAGAGNGSLKGVAFSNACSSPFKMSRSSIRGSKSRQMRDTTPSGREDCASGPLPANALSVATDFDDIRTALSGVRAENIAYIWLISRPQQGIYGNSAQFFDAEGNRLLAVHLNCANPKELEAFAEMRARFGVKSVPRVPFEARPESGKRCCGCGNCTCNGNGGKHGRHHGHGHLHAVA